MATLLQDLRFAVRILRKSPAFALVAIITMALAIGANTAVYSVVKAVLLTPLPLPDANRLVQINEYSRLTGQERDWIPFLDALDFERDARSFENVGDYRHALLNSSEGAGLPEALYGLQTTSELLPALGVSPALGRFFTADETRLGHHHEVILSDELWRRRFAADRGIVGKTIHLNTEPYLVIGVMPRGFNFPLKLATKAHLPSRQMQYWVPMALDPAKQHRADDSTVAVARLKPGVTLEEAQAEMDALGARLAQLYPDTHAARRFRLQRLQDQVVGEVRPVLLVLFAAVALVLLIAGANLANLLLARNTARQREMAIRLAIGASPFRAVRQRLTENLVLALVGGGIGLAVAGLRLCCRACFTTPVRGILQLCSWSVLSLPQ